MASVFLALATMATAVVIQRPLAVSAAAQTAPTIAGGPLSTVQLVQDDLPLSDYYTGSIQISSSGTPTPTLTMTSGTLPPGLTFTPNIFGGALITGSSPPSAAGTYAVTVTSSNGVAPDADPAHHLCLRDHEDDHDPVCVAQRRVHRSAGHAHSDGQPGAKRGNGDLHP